MGLYSGYEGSYKANDWDAAGCINGVTLEDFFSSKLAVSTGFLFDRNSPESCGGLSSFDGDMLKAARSESVGTPLLPAPKLCRLLGCAAVEIRSANWLILLGTFS